MIKVYKCYSLETNEPDVTLELWESSTKHPDSKFYFSNFKKCDFFNDEVQIFQWLLECASRLTMPFYAKELTEYALENWCIWKEDCPNKDFKIKG